MLVLHPLDPLDLRRPDDAYAAEATACDRLGIGWTLIDHDALVQGDVERADVVVLYRGLASGLGQEG